MANHSPFLLALCILLSLTFQRNVLLVLAEETCGSLITYRQFSSLLETAPQCFLDGCAGQSVPTSMSDTCPAEEPCFDLWSLLRDQHQQDWCANCEDDIACRIPGWPILNATALCNVAPNSWIFGTQGACCTAGNQSFQLAEWIGTMCNGSEWRKPFDFYSGMAELDWEEWILPWNWTVRAENSSTVTVPPSHCSRTPLALLAFAAENVLFLTFGVVMAILKLAWIRGREKDIPWVIWVHRKCHVLTYLNFWSWPVKIWRWVRNRQEDPDNRIPRWTTSVLWSVLMTSLQVGFNFASAYIIKRTPGYQNVPVGRLAILFCCRPRLAWLACALDLIDQEELKRRFHFESEGYLKKAQLALGSVGIGSAISEMTLQASSAYYMGLTANTGRIRGFYLLHHLRPFWKGRDARHMYLGALFWLIGCFFIFVTWPLLLFFGIVFSHFVQRQSEWIKLRLRRKEKHPAPGPTTVFITPGGAPTIAQDRPPEPEDSNLEKVPSDLEKASEEEAGTGSAEIINQGDMNERVGPTTEIIDEGDMNERVGPMSSNDHQRVIESENMRADDGAFSSENETLLGQHAVSSPLSSTIIGDRSGASNLSRSSARGITIQGEELPHDERPLMSESNDDRPHEQPADPTPGQEGEEERRERKKLLIGLVIVIGFLSWAVQWAFWAGFVYAAGPR
jgi:hypothetical protein